MADAVASDCDTESNLFARRLLLVQYCARLPPRSSRFRWPPAAALLAVQPYLFSDLLSCPPYGEARSSDRPGSSRVKLYPATTRYEKAFLKELIARLQDAVDQQARLLSEQGDVDETEYPEVDADILERYAELMATTSGGAAGSAGIRGPPENEHVTYLWQQTTPSLPLLQGHSSLAQGQHDEDADGGDDEKLLRGFASATVREEGSAISKGTTGLKTWEACLRLANYLLAYPDLILAPGSRVLELGSGAGLLGSVCSIEQRAADGCDGTTRNAASTRQTCLTDMPGQVLERLEETLHLNGVDTRSGETQISALDWVELHERCSKLPFPSSDVDMPTDTKDDDDPTALLGNFQPTLILAADVVYDPDLCRPLAATIRTALESSRDNDQVKALVASTIRNPTTYSTFKEALASANLQVDVLSITQKHMCPPAARAGETGWEPLPFFPSVHDPSCDGTVELLEIKLR